MASTSTSKKKNLHSLVVTNLSKLTVTLPSSSSSSSSASSDFDLLFGPNQSPSPLPSPSLRVIHSRSHSFVGPSPRYIPPSSSPFYDDVIQEAESESEIVIENKKIGVGDFEILRVVGQGAFGKVFQVRRKGDLDDGDNDDDGDDGIYAMKVMRKDTIIKRNQVDYMKAERDILTKVLHPFIVRLRYSFQVISKFLFS